MVKGAPAGSCWRFHKRLSRPRRARVATRRPSRELAFGSLLGREPRTQSACSGVTQPSKPKLPARSLGCSGCSTRSALCCWSAAGRGVYQERRSTLTLTLTLTLNGYRPHARREPASHPDRASTRRRGDRTVNAQPPQPRARVRERRPAPGRRAGWPPRRRPRTSCTPLQVVERGRRRRGHRERARLVEDRGGAALNPRSFPPTARARRGAARSRRRGRLRRRCGCRRKRRRPTSRAAARRWRRGHRCRAVRDAVAPQLAVARVIGGAARRP